MKKLEPADRGIAALLMLVGATFGLWAFYGFGVAALSFAAFWLIILVIDSFLPGEKKP